MKKIIFLSRFAAILVISGTIMAFSNTSVSGAKAHQTTSQNPNDDSKVLAKRIKDLSDKYNLGELRKELYAVKDRVRVVTKEREAEINSIISKYDEDAKQLTVDFIKEYPKSPYSAVLVAQLTSGKSAAEIEKYLKLLDPSLANDPKVIELNSKVNEMKKTEVGIGAFVSGAHDLSYKVDNNFAGKQHKDVVYLAILSNSNICAFKKDGSVRIIDSKGATVNEFKTEITTPSAITVDKSDNIFVLGSVIEKKTVDVRGKSSQVSTPVGVECQVYNAKGAKIRDMKLSGVVTATGARISQNNLLVADTRGRSIVIFDAETGAKKSAIEKLRTCCGILDFTVRKNNEVLVANLGAFRVEGFDYNGKSIISFGQRGNTIDEFHGCCNPVSVAFLSNGGIVTVEKDPTRIKVYSKEGAKKVEGIDELVKGCAYIPMTVDRNDNLYLASKTDGIVKCKSSK
ncbi:MAG: hypothetical protein A2X18_01890 [Bacteroidetes bacterium GWF2_40_14]|nr:MAG: hypothetical protein A2X18_01890 [Bacteroidetes bacterium GWF2_40_14]